MRNSLVAIISLVFATPSFAQGNVGLSIADESFSQSDVLDARYLPSIDGKPTIMITFSETAARRVGRVTERNVGKAIPIAVNGKTISTPVFQAAILQGVVEIGGIADMQEAIALAKQISGKDPLPDSLEE